MKRYRFLIIAVGYLCALLVTASSTTAQVAYLDQGTLIESLANEGMSELLDRLAETDAQQDPLTAPLIEIARLHARYSDTRISREDQLAAFGQMVQATRRLIEQNENHEMRPLWQTKLADLLLFEKLQVQQQNAAAYYEFGVPTDPQRRAFEAVVTETLELLSDADATFFRLKTQLPLEPDHEQKRVLTGLWARMIDEYYGMRTPFMLAHAAYYTSLLPYDHPYYKDLNNPKIPRQEKTPQRERVRLKRLAADSLAPLIRKTSDPYGVRLSAMCLAGRAMLDQPTQVNQAIQYFDAIDEAGMEDFNHLLGQLAKAVALDQTGPPGPPDQLLARLISHPLVKENLLIRLLLVDQVHKLRLARARRLPPEAQTMALAQAYKPYEDLLADPALGEDTVGLKNYVYNRWEEMIQPGANTADLPATVVAAAGEMSRLRGEALTGQASQLEEAGKEQEAESLYAQAKPLLERAILINNELLVRADLTPRTRAGAMFNVAMAGYLIARGDSDQRIAAGRIWTDLAQQMPDQPLAETAIDSAMKVLRYFYDMEPKPEGVVEAYEHAADVLFKHFPTTPTADQERVYFAFHVLEPRGEYNKAVQLLSKVPKNHPRYFEAQRELLSNLNHLFQKAEKPGDKTVAGNRLVEAAGRVVREAKALAPGATAQLQQDALSAHGAARLILTDVAITNGNTDQALKYLQDFERQFQSNAELVRLGLSKRIVALAQSGNFGELVAQAKRMMDIFPNDAAAVIDEVLTDLNKRIDRVRRDAQQVKVQNEKQRLEKQTQSYAQAALMLSELLMDWAVRQGFAQDDLMPYKLGLAKANLLANQPKVAIDIIEPMLEQLPNETELIHSMGEAMFVIGDKQSLLDAATYYDQLIGGLGPPYPPIWWNAWMRRLQIMEKLGQSVEDIPLRVRALELTDPNLGGEPYRSEFKRLQLKHAIQ